MYQFLEAEGDANGDNHVTSEQKAGHPKNQSNHLY